jgi:DNA-binding Lrp family transcriptional regulator
MPSEQNRANNKDRQIAQEIAQNPRASIPLIAKLTGIPESTVGKRLAALMQAHRIGRILQIFNWPAMGYQRRYRIDILVDQRSLTKGEGGLYEPPPKLGEKDRPKAETQRIYTQEQLAIYIKYTLGKKYEGRIVVLDVSILLGHAADLTVTVCARGGKSILDFVTNGLRPLGGIQSTSTSEEIWTCPPFPELVAAADQIEILEKPQP